MTMHETLAADLNERLKLQYMGACRCGRCQLVPIALIERAVAALSVITIYESWMKAVASECVVVEGRG